MSILSNRPMLPKYRQNMAPTHLPLVKYSTYFILFIILVLLQLWMTTPQKFEPEQIAIGDVRVGENFYPIACFHHDKYDAHIIFYTVRHDRNRIIFDGYYIPFHPFSKMHCNSEVIFGRTDLRGEFEIYAGEKLAGHLNLSDNKVEWFPLEDSTSDPPRYEPCFQREDIPWLIMLYTLWFVMLWGEVGIVILACFKN